jgi:phenylacetic acid degradation operon negative regulatory protein
MLSLLLGMHPPRLAAAELVRWCALFDVDERAARTALSRMTGVGEVRASDAVYELGSRVLERQRRQDVAVADESPTQSWDGSWWIRVVTADDRTARSRAALRAEMAAAHFAEQREGVWTRPRNPPSDGNAPTAQAADALAQCRTWVAEPVDDPGELAAALWDLGVLGDGANDALHRLDEARRMLGRDGSPAIPAAFRAGAEALVHLRADPRLPAALVPQPWPADALRAAYRDYQPEFAAAVRAWRRGS